MSGCSENSEPRVPEEGARIHRSFYAASAVRTAVFYGTVLIVCLVFNVLVALGISVFFLRFYRKEVAGFLGKPLRVLGGKQPPELDAYRFEVLPPGSFKGMQ
jgi:hypothetical protein